MFFFLPNCKDSLFLYDWSYFIGGGKKAGHNYAWPSDQSQPEEWVGIGVIQ